MRRRKMYRSTFGTMKRKTRNHSFYGGPGRKLNRSIFSLRRRKGR